MCARCLNFMQVEIIISDNIRMWHQVKDHCVSPTLKDKPKTVFSFAAPHVKSTSQLHVDTSERTDHKTGPGIQVVTPTQTAACKVQL